MQINARKDFVPTENVVKIGYGKSKRESFGSEVLTCAAI
jgi:hypothetical protein